VFADVQATVSTHSPHAEYSPFPQAGQHGVWEPERTAIVTDSGQLIEERTAPRPHFEGHAISTPWDRQNLLYFAGYAVWTYPARTPRHSARAVRPHPNFAAAS
jgi:hypothetical protein